MPKKNTPYLTVIICTYNTKAITLKCLNKLKTSITFLAKPVETIVIENGTDGTGEILNKNYPWIKVITPAENTGFAIGNNLGIKASDKNTKYYLFLNSDVLIKRETLRQSVDFIEQHNACDALGCTLTLGNGKLQMSAGFFPTPTSVFTWIMGIDLLPVINRLLKSFHQRNISFFKDAKQVDWVMGAYLFMKKEVVEKTKGLDENFFMYTEEVEWCKRIKDAGYAIWYTPGFKVTHLDKASSKTNPEKYRKIAYKEIIGVIYFLKKYYPKTIHWTLTIIKIGLCLRIAAFFMLGNTPRRLTYQEVLKAI